MPHILNIPTARVLLLLADDDADDRDLFTSALHKIAPDVQLKTVNDGRQLIEYLSRCSKDQLPCSVIIDYNMPHMNAVQVLDWLCSRSLFDGINKFVWSTAYQQEYIDGCKDHGALEYFIKPDTEDGLFHIVQRILSQCGQ
jgi:CheY-like chemotaxis protein